MHNSHYDCFMVTIMKNFSAFLDNGHYGSFMVTIMKDLSAFLDNGHYGYHYERPFSSSRYMYQKPIKGPHLLLVK